jgi:hypothetical protein
LLGKLAHLALVVVGWAGFVWLWMLVAARPWDSRGLVWLILGSLLVAPLLTGAWVLHNRSLYRRKGERRAVAAADMAYERDWHGRVVQADWAVLRDSCQVVISVEGGRKVYHGRPARPADQQGRPASAASASPRAPAPAPISTLR